MLHSRLVLLLGVVLPLMYIGCKPAPPSVPARMTATMSQTPEYSGSISGPPEFEQMTIRLPATNADKYVNLPAGLGDSIHVRWNDVSYPKKNMLAISGELFNVVDGKESIV